jgi:hypothetical protein
MRAAALAALAIAALAVPLADCGAQYSRRTHSREEARNRERPDDRPLATEPWQSLERELISLRGDLRIRADQADAWNGFERAVRDAADAERDEARTIVELDEKGAAPPTAAAFLGRLAEDDRRKADAAARVETELHALEARLDAAQRSMLDRRVIQSQAEPLGRGPASR